ncbi:probable glutamate receptor [Macrobrachium nipponense]|uniref:probable glutamate receptor n=1 Tax=Macrobrachium nipponense TaxID=159736 RepID=UPI0030C88391
MVILTRNTSSAGVKRKLSVKEALKDPVTLKDLLMRPGTFRYRLVRPADGEWGSKKPSGRWSGMVGQVYYQETDIALGPHDLTEIRKTAIDYTTPIFNDARKFVVGQSRAEVDPWGFLLPLTPLVWVGTLVSLLIVGFITTAIAENYKGEPLMAYATAVFFHTYRIIIVQGMTMKLEKVSERTMVLSWIFGAMIICWSYSTNLMSLLAVRYAPRPIQSIQDLLDNDKMTVIFTPNTALTDYIENVESGLLRDIVNLRLVGRYKDIHFTEFPKVLGTLVLRGDHVIATDTTDGTRLIANYFSQFGSCNFYMAREAFVPFVMGMIGQQGSPLVEALTHRIGAIVAGGMYRQWLDSNFANSSSCRHMPSRFTVREPLAMINIWGLFVLLASGLLVAGLIFLLELFFANVSGVVDISAITAPVFGRREM